MTKIRLMLAVALANAALLTPASAAIDKDDYNGKDAVCAGRQAYGGCADSTWRKNGSENSPRGYAWRNCTDFAAFRANQLAGRTVVPSGWGNANTWDDRAKAAGFKVNSTPLVGDIAQTDIGGGGFGHVGIVAQVGSGAKAKRIRIEEYNWITRTVGRVSYFDGRYHKSRWLPASRYKYIHVQRSGGSGVSNALKADLVVHEPTSNTWAVATSTGSSFSGFGTGLSGWGRGDWSGLADVTGDGRADIVSHDPSSNTFAVAVNRGNGHFTGSGTWLSGWGADEWAGLADVVGNDAKADLVVYDRATSSWSVARSTGRSFTGLGIGLSGWSSGDWSGLGDVNQDGRADLVVHDPISSSFAVALADGTGRFGAPGTGTWLSGWGAGDWVGLADVDADRRDDLVVHDPVMNTWAVALSKGTRFSGAGIGLSGWGRGDWTGLADVTGDRKADIVVHDPSNATYVVAVANSSGRFNGSGAWLAGWSAGGWVGFANVNNN
jgi:surface antigen